MRGTILLLLIALSVPVAAAFDVLPDMATTGPTEARFLVRASGPLQVEADGPVLVAVATVGGAPGPMVPAPAALAPPPGAEWHGLAGVFELVVARDDPARPVSLTVTDGREGAVLEWPASPRPVPLPAWAPILALALQTGLRSCFTRRRLRPRRRSVSLRFPMWLFTMRTLPLKRSVICSGFAPKR